jgi:hypothetical protein
MKKAIPGKELRGSKILTKIFENYGLKYNKVKSGLVIAQRVTLANQPALTEIVDRVKRLFE